MQNFHKLGDILVELFSNYVTVTSQEASCCTLKDTLNTWGPYLATRHIRSILDVIKSTTEYQSFASNNPNRPIDRLLVLFIKKAIKKSLLDNQPSPTYTLVTTTEKEPNDATEERQQPTDNLHEHSTGDEVRQTTETSHSNRYEQSRNVKKDFRRKGKKR